MKRKMILQIRLAVGIACCFLLSCNKEQLNLDSGNSVSLQSSSVSPNALIVVPPVAIDYDGNHYNTVILGTQTWIKRNLEVTCYNNGDSIPNITNNIAWINTKAGAYCYYNNTANYKNYGVLYNWFAITDSRNLCPAGYHVPSHNDWVTLENFLGGIAIAGGKLKSTGTIEGGDGLWYYPNLGATNSTGFRGWPTGFRYFMDGQFHDDGVNCYFWTSTTQDNMAWSVALSCYNAAVYHQDYFAEYFEAYKNYGMSVRCLKN